MRIPILLPVLLFALCSRNATAQAPASAFPAYPAELDQPPAADWLLTAPGARAAVFQQNGGHELVLWNGLVKRVFRLAPNVACTEYKNLVSGEQLLRAVKPEACVVLNGRAYNVGGLYGQRQNAYLRPEWADQFTAGTQDFQLASVEEKTLRPRIRWKRNRWSGQSADPTGKEVVFHYRHADTTLAQVELRVHYEIYDGLPLLCKWLSIHAAPDGAAPVLRVGRVVNEILAAVEEESAVVGKPERMKKPHGLYIESNYCFNNAMRAEISDQTTHWLIDSAYTSQVNVDPAGIEKGFLLLFNPLNAPIVRRLRIPLYYTGLTEQARFESDTGETAVYALNRAYEAEIDVELPAGGMRWWVIR